MVDLTKIQTGDKDLELIQSNVQSALKGVQALPLVGGNLLQSVALTSGVDNPVAHGLSYTPKSWILADQNTDSRVWRTSWDSRFVTLRCSTTCTISVWVG